MKRGTVAVDGSKANASKHKAMSYGRRQQGEKRLRKEIRERMGKARKPDTQEDKRYGQDRRGDEVPAELSRREDRLQKIQEARKYLEARQVEADRAAGRDPGDQDGTGKPGKPFKRPFGEPPAKAQENCTDPDSRLMKRGGSGFEPCYNVQIAVDETERVVVATAVTQSASDIDPLIPLLDAVEENLGAQAGCYLADAGDRSESKLQALEERGIDGDGAMGRAKAGKKPLSPDLEATGRMARKLRTKRGEKSYRKRKRIGEPPFSWIQSAMGFDPFHLRGLLKTIGEWDLACLAANLRRMQRRREWT